MRIENIKDLIGMRFGRWLVKDLAEKRKNTNGHNLNYYICLCDCGKTKSIYRYNLISGKSSSCGCVSKEKNIAMSGQKSKAWKGGKYIDGGYVMVYIKKHPKAKKNGYVREHVVVMEQKLGRQLILGENVHHINGLKTDNRIENLELWSVSQPCGQRVEDKLKWAKEIIELYG